MKYQLLIGSASIHRPIEIDQSALDWKAIATWSKTISISLWNELSQMKLLCIGLLEGVRHPSIAAPHLEIKTYSWSLSAHVHRNVKISKTNMASNLPFVFSYNLYKCILVNFHFHCSCVFMLCLGDGCFNGLGSLKSQKPLPQTASIQSCDHFTISANYIQRDLSFCFCFC